MAFLSQEEKKHLSLAPFLIADLFDVDIKNNIAPFLSSAKKVSLRKKDILLNLGQTVDNIFYVNTGVIGDVMINQNGLEQLSINFPNCLAGFGSAAHKQPIIFSSYALTEAEVYVLPYIDFLTFMQQNSKLLTEVLKYASLDARRTNYVILQHSSCSALQKVSLILYCCHIARKHYAEFKQLKLTQKLIASLAGIHRISAIHALKELREKKYITLDKQELFILEPAMLKDIGFEI